MLKVGDKVKIRENLEVGQRYGGEIFARGYMESLKGKEATITDIFTDGCNIDIDIENWNWTEEMLEKIEEKNMKELTFREVIANIKEGEVWENQEPSLITKSIEMINGKIIIQLGSDRTCFGTDGRYVLQRKQYTFEEAFKAFEEGKEIESCVSEYCYKLREDFILKRHYSVNQVEVWENDESLIRINEIREPWYIND